MTKASLHAGILFFVVISVLRGFPPAGQDAFDSSAAIRLDLTESGGAELTLNVVGPARILRREPRRRSDGREAVSAEIVALELRGNSPLGPVVVRESPLRRSAGSIVQQEPGADFPADSFFDLFLEIETPSGVFLHNNPIRLQQVITAIPPSQQEYVPIDGFRGVQLFDREGRRVGRLLDARHFAGQQPSFSVAPAGSSGLGEGVVHDLPTAPRIAPAGLGLVPADDIDALSYGTDVVRPVQDLRFSIDPQGGGLPGTAVRREAGSGEAHGDEFRVTSPARTGGDNELVLDEDGSSAPPFPLLVSDDVDALAEPPAIFVDPDADGIPDNEVLFSLRSGSPTLSGSGFSPADILSSASGASPVVFRGFQELGLVRSDELDALCVDRITGRVLLSLAPGSPTLLAGGFGPGDLFLVDDEPTRPPLRFATAFQLGLQDTDNVNAIQCALPEVDYFAESEMQVRVEGELVTLRGPSLWHVGVGPNGEVEYPERAPLDQAPMELVRMELVGRTSLGTARLRIRDFQKAPFQHSEGFILEMENRRSGVLDLPPFQPQGEARVELALYVEVEILGEVFHNNTPLQMSGTVSSTPPRFGETFSAEQEIDVVDEQGGQSEIALVDVTYTPDVLVAPDFPEFRSEGVVDAAGFAVRAAPNSINSLFGSKLATLTRVAREVPLPTSLAGTSITIESNPLSAALSGERRQNTLDAPLFFVSPGQINFLIPPGAAPGPATLTVTTPEGATSAAMEISAVVPGLFSANASGQGVAAAQALTVLADGTRSTEFAFDTSAPAGQRTGVPLDLGGEGDGVFLILFGTGIRGAGSVSLQVGGEPAQVFFAGEQGQFVGLDQVNAGPLSRNLIGQGEVDVVLTADGVEANIVTVTIR